jgi:tetratricopeptide (TPR) repeat protein
MFNPISVKFLQDFLGDLRNLPVQLSAKEFNDVSGQFGMALDFVRGLKVLKNIRPRPQQEERELLLVIEVLEFIYLRILESDPILSTVFVLAVVDFSKHLGAFGKYRERVEIGRKALIIAQRANDPAAAELLGSTIAWALLQLGEYEKAKISCERGLALAEQLGDYLLVGNIAHTLAGIARDQGNIEMSEFWANKVLESANRTSNLNLSAWAGMDLANVAMHKKSYSEAERNFRLTLQYTDSKNLLQVANRKGDLALSLFNQGKFEEAFEEIKKVIRLEIENPVLQGEIKFALQKFAEQKGDFEKGAQLNKEGKALFASEGLTRPGRWEEWAKLPNAQ